jgi:hypothetical protein
MVVVTLMVIAAGIGNLYLARFAAASPRSGMALAITGSLCLLGGFLILCAACRPALAPRPPRYRPSRVHRGSVAGPTHIHLGRKVR